VKQAMNSFGRVSQCIAVEMALRALGNARLDPGLAGTACVGLCGTWEGLNVQVNYYTP
jgi:nicotinamide mononucleotide (NMN) deamidase PncC